MRAHLQARYLNTASPEEHVKEMTDPEDCKRHDSAKAAVLAARKQLRHYVHVVQRQQRQQFLAMDGGGARLSADASSPSSVRLLRGDSSGGAQGKSLADSLPDGLTAVAQNPSVLLSGGGAPTAGGVGAFGAAPAQTAQRGLAGLKIPKIR